MRYAVILAGIPGSIINRVLTGIRSKYPDNYVFRGAGCRTYHSRLASYDSGVIEDTLRLASDAVFAKSKRPLGFCRNDTRSCGLLSNNKSSCRYTPEASCALRKPDFLILLFQAGVDEGCLMGKFHHAAYAGRLSPGCYNRVLPTLREVERSLQEAPTKLGLLKRSFTSRKSPFLLPPLNFGSKHLQKLLAQPLGAGLTDEAERFRNEYFDKKTLAYRGRSDLMFKPIDSSSNHGVPDLLSQYDLALSRVFRLGCQYAPDFHYDVSRKDGNDLAGKITFHCRSKGECRPRGTHVNLLVDDCIR